MKVRDQDEKIRLMAFQRLTKFPMNLLSESLTHTEWRSLFERGFAEEKKEFKDLAEVI